MLSDIEEEIQRLENEVSEVYRTLVLPNWGKELHGFPQTLYGYMMELFSFIDLLSSYWQGNEQEQSKRMLSFMNKYIRNKNEENSVSIQVWRHKLMHTAKPRALQNETKQKTYYWLLHWYEHLPEEQHYTFSETMDKKILNIGLVYLINDIKKGLTHYKKELVESDDLIKKYESHNKNLETYTYHDIALLQGTPAER